MRSRKKFYYNKQQNREVLTLTIDCVNPKFYIENLQSNKSDATLQSYRVFFIKFSWFGKSMSSKTCGWLEGDYSP